MARRTPHGTTADNEDCRRSGCYLLLGCMSAQACNRHPSRSVVVAVLCIRIIFYNSLTALTSSRTWPSSSIMSLSPPREGVVTPQGPQVCCTQGEFYHRALPKNAFHQIDGEVVRVHQLCGRESLDVCFDLAVRAQLCHIAWTVEPCERCEPLWMMLRRILQDSLTPLTCPPCSRNEVTRACQRSWT